MKRINVILSTIILFLMVVSSVLFNACTKDPCKSTICRNEGVCRDGQCKCKLGYEGVNCETNMYEKFIGVWDGSFRCNGNPSILVTNIVQPGAKPNEINIYNVFNQGLVLSATLDIEKITIKPQTFGNITYSGTGDLLGKYVTLFIQQLDSTTNKLTSCVYNATKFSTP
jgi:hypothetical protein